MAETKPKAGACPQSTGQITFTTSYKPDRAVSRQLHHDAYKRLAQAPRQRSGQMLKLLAEYDRFETKARAAKRRAQRKLRNGLLSAAVAIAVVTLGVGLGSFYMNVQGGDPQAEAANDSPTNDARAARFELSDLPAPAVDAPIALVRLGAKQALSVDVRKDAPVGSSETASGEDAQRYAEEPLAVIR